MFDFQHLRRPAVWDNLLQETAVFTLFFFHHRGIKYEMVSGEIYCSRIYTRTRAYPYRMIVWMHNAPSPTPPIRSFRDRFDGATLYICGIYIYICIKYVVDITSLYRPFCQNLFVVWELRSSISSQRTFRTDLLSTAQRRRRVQRHNCTRIIIYKCKVRMHVRCIYRLCPFIPRLSTKGGSWLNLF